MTLWKRIWLYLSRKKGRSMLLFVIVFGMATFMLLGIAVRTSADQAAEDLRKSIGSSFILEVDDENPEYRSSVVEENGYSYTSYIGPVLTESIIDQIMDVEGVSDCLVDVVKMAWTELELRPGMWEDSYSWDVRYMEEHPGEVLDRAVSLEEAKMQMGVTDLYCCSDNSLHSMFRMGALELVQGRNLREGDCCKAVISEELAQLNGLSVGDTFTVESKEGMYQPAQDPFLTWGEPIRLEIIGLFHANFFQEPSIYTVESGYAENYIFTDMETSSRIDAALAEHGRGRKSGEKQYGRATFFVEDPALLDGVLSKVRSLPSIQGLLLKLDDVAYRASVKPLRQMSGFSAFLVTASVLGVAIVLYLVMSLWIRERKRELGILLSMGFGKLHLQLQLILEAALVTSFALMLSFLAAGSTVSSVGAFAQKAASAGETKELYHVEFDMFLNPVVEKVAAEPVHLSYTLSLENILLIVVLLLAVTVGSVCLASRQILRRPPRDILSSI